VHFVDGRQNLRSGYRPGKTSLSKRYRSTKQAEHKFLVGMLIDQHQFENVVKQMHYGCQSHRYIYGEENGKCQ
jgi:hypothetical protein